MPCGAAGTGATNLTNANDAEAPRVRAMKSSIFAAARAMNAARKTSAVATPRCHQLKKDCHLSRNQ